jgi:hypothetical protein
MRLLADLKPECKLIACKCLQETVKKPHFNLDPFIKMKIHHLWIDSLIGNLTFKQTETMIPIFETLDCLICACHVKHSAEYLDLWDKVVKVTFSTSIVLSETSQKICILQIATRLFSRLEVASVLYLKDWILLMESCLSLNSFDSVMRDFLPAFLAWNWAVLQEQLGFLLGILMEFISLHHQTLEECHFVLLREFFGNLAAVPLKKHDDDGEEFGKIFAQTASSFPKEVSNLLNALVKQNSTD